MNFWYPSAVSTIIQGLYKTRTKKAPYNVHVGIAPNLALGDINMIIKETNNFA